MDWGYLVGRMQRVVSQQLTEDAMNAQQPVPVPQPVPTNDQVRRWLGPIHRGK